VGGGEKTNIDGAVFQVSEIKKGAWIKKKKLKKKSQSDGGRRKV